MVGGRWLDQLVRLGKDGADIPRRRLQDVAAEYATDVAVDKVADADYWINYALLQGVDLRRVEDDGWFTYPAKDVWATCRSYTALHERGRDLTTATTGSPIGPATAAWGLLTAAVQVQASIALQAVTRNGLRVDAGYRHALRARLDARVRTGAALFNRLAASDSALGPIVSKRGPLFVPEGGDFKRTKKGFFPAAERDAS